MSPIRPFFLVQLSLLLRFILLTTCSPSLNAGGNIQLVLNEVPPAGHCLPVKITWTGGIPPFTISISPEPAGTIGRAGIHDTIPNSRAYVWTPSFPAGASAHIIIIDSTPSRLQVWRDVVVSGSNKTCISQSTSSSVPSQSTTSKVSTFTPPLGSPSPSYNVKSSTTATGATSSLSSTLVVVSGFNSSIATGASVRGKLASSECPTSVPTRTSCHSGPQSIAITATSPAVTSEAAGPSTQSDSGHVSRSRKTLSSGAIFGIVFGSITLLAALALLIYRTRARRRREDLTQGMCFEYYIANTMSDNMSIVCYYTVLQHAVQVGTSPQEKPSSNRLLQSATIRRSSGCSSLHWTSGQRRTECDPSQHGVSFHLYYPSRGTIFIPLIPTSRFIPQIPQFQDRFHLYDLIPHPCR